MIYTFSKWWFSSSRTLSLPLGYSQIPRCWSLTYIPNSSQSFPILSQMISELQRVPTPSNPGWWFQSLWKISESIGMMTFPIWWESHKIHLPKHQPEPANKKHQPNTPPPTTFSTQVAQWSQVHLPQGWSWTLRQFPRPPSWYGAITAMEAMVEDMGIYIYNL
jgi:hypothetical protein